MKLISEKVEREKERECIDELVDFMNSSIYAYYILNILAHLIE